MPTMLMEPVTAPRSNAHPSRCTLIIPTYNAAGFIAQTVQRLREFVATHPRWVVLFVCDGCCDDTVSRLSAELSPATPALAMHTYQDNRGKGYALRRALNLVRTPYAVYTDVDLAYDPDEALKVLQLLENGADLAGANPVGPARPFLVNTRSFSTHYQRPPLDP